jgi:hypothetical protein
MACDEEQIRALVQAFADAVAADPFERMLCREEREILEQEVDPELVLPESPRTVPQIGVSDIAVQDDIA